MEEFKNFSASSNDLMPYEYCHDLFLAFVYFFGIFISSLSYQSVTLG